MPRTPASYPMRCEPGVPRLVIVLTLHVAASDNGAAVADDAWIGGEVAVAGDKLEGAGATFSQATGSARGEPADVDSVADRDGLAALADDDGTVHVFVVARL